MSQNSGPGFSNVQNAPTVQQPAHPGGPQRIKTNSRYLCSFTGILRFALILFQFAGWISAAAVFKPGGTGTTTGDIAATRSAYLFFSIVGFLLAIIIFLIFFMNIISLGFFNRLPWSLILLATNLLWLIPTFVLGIVSAVRETDVKALGSDAYNVGAFGAASFFAFLCTVIYGLDAGYHLMQIVRGGVGSPPSYAT